MHALTPIVATAGRRPKPVSTLFLALAMLWTTALSLATAALAQDGDTLNIAVVSSPPEYVSGGDARLVVSVPRHIALADVTVWSGNRQVTDDFLPRGDAHALEGVVSGLSLGTTTITAFAGPHKATLDLTNHDIRGPMFSGPAQEVFVCSTESHRATAGLGDVLDEDCSLARRVDFLYLSSRTNGFELFDPAAGTPADAALVDGTLGEKPLIVRWERGTINRFIYSIAIPSIATQDVDAPDTTGWNGRLVYQFQGGVGIGHYQGSPSRGNMLNQRLLANGYAVAYSTGNRTSTHYDLIVGGETAIMVKDRFVTAYGAPLYTVGLGGSGGGIQQYVYAQNHPGLLDALIPQYSYPDMVTQTIHVGDCELLERFMDAKVAADPDSRWATWSDRSLLQGMNASDDLPNPYNQGAPGLTECINGWRGLSPLAFNPHFGTAPGISLPQQFGTHWTYFEDIVQVVGRRDDGYARSSWDNVGVQYGLRALLSGDISPEEFLELNAEIGGWKDQAAMVQEGCPFLEPLCAIPTQFDPTSSRNMRLSDGERPAPRTEGDLGAIRAIWDSGLVFIGDRLGVPAIDWRHYLERQLDMHNSVQSFVTRQRIIEAGGDPGEMVVWFTDTTDDNEFDQTPLALQVIDQWLANLRADPSLSVTQARPAAAVDSCFDASGELIYAGEDAWAGILDAGPKGPCAERFEVYSNSRVVAGGPITGDVFKCALQSVDEAIRRGVYGAWQPTAEEREQLLAIFPTGVCDYDAGNVHLAAWFN
ncbi:MAG: hypothetical protein KF813_04495 [Trueperaceae bacterium]|nr:hypothetical protein [Trueperaceae bacterium]